MHAPHGAAMQHLIWLRLQETLTQKSNVRTLHAAQDIGHTYCSPTLQCAPACFICVRQQRNLQTSQPSGIIMFRQPAVLASQDAALQRSFAAEPIVAIAASADGCHVAGGGASGHLYLWQAASGRLLRSWPAHYKVCLRYCSPGN